jgi:hypothetical protein
VLPRCTYSYHRRFRPPEAYVDTCVPDDSKFAATGVCAHVRTTHLQTGGRCRLVTVSRLPWRAFACDTLAARPVLVHFGGYEKGGRAVHARVHVHAQIN